MFILIVFIFLVQNNLNTHTPSLFYVTFDAEKAFNLTKDFRIIFNLKKSSLLNMGEIEFSALLKQCLNRRIPIIEMMRNEVVSWQKQRNLQKAAVHWQFT